MKNYLKTIFCLVASLLVGHHSVAQRVHPDALARLVGKIIVSEVSSGRPPSDFQPPDATGEVSGNVVVKTGGGVQIQMFRTVAISSDEKKNRFGVVLEIDRMRQQLPGPDGQIASDTKDVFSDDPMTQSMNDNNRQFVSRPVRLVFDQAGTMTEAKDTKPSVRRFWTGLLRIALHPVAELSGVVQPLPARFSGETMQWTDTVTGNGGRYINRYRVLSATAQAVTLKLDGTLLPAPLASPEASRPKADAPPANGGSIGADVVVKRLAYTGEITFDPATALIGLAIITGEMDRETTVLGQTVGGISQANYRITNQLSDGKKRK